MRDQEGRNVVVAWSNECNATYRDVSQLSSCQEEADTKMILHAMDATMHGLQKSISSRQIQTCLSCYCVDTQSFVKT